MGQEHLTDEQTSVLIGSMLGDGHLQLGKHSRNARLTIRRCIKDAEYLLWEHSVFEDFCSSNAIREYCSFDKRTNKSYPGIGFQTLIHPIFTEYHNEWYKDKKRVPNKLSLNQMIMLVWFLDDGCAIIGDHGKISVKLATDGFCGEDTLFLLDLLQNRYKQKYTTHANGNGFNINGYGSAAEAIINDISPIFPNNIMARKAVWNHNDPKIHTFDVKRAKIEEYLANKETFYAKELARFVGFTYQKNGETKTQISNLTKWYLPEYIDNGLIVRLENDSYHTGNKYGITDEGAVYFRSRERICSSVE